MNASISPTTSISPSTRLSSLDILRGFDLFLLVFFRPVLVSLGSRLQLPWMDSLLYQFDHEVWAGFRFWDLVMPLFLFMSGVSMPFSFAKYAAQGDKRAIYLKVLRRFIILWVLGMVVQGNLLGLDPQHLYLYSNTLQSIATGYLLSALLLLHCSLRWQVAAALLLLLIYWVPMTLCDDFTPEGNFAELVDRAVLGRFRDGVYWDEAGCWHFAPSYTYTWIWSSLTFGVSVMLGAFAGQIIRRGSGQDRRGSSQDSHDSSQDRRKVVTQLLSIGVLLIAAALLWSLQMPIIKRIWTSSMTLFAGGCCFLLMGLFYYWIDYKGHTRGLEWLKIYGMNSITAYLLGEVINFRSVAASVSYGLEQYLGKFYPTWLTFANFLILFFILRWMYRHKLFLKI